MHTSLQVLQPCATKSQRRHKQWPCSTSRHLASTKSVQNLRFVHGTQVSKSYNPASLRDNGGVTVRHFVTQAAAAAAALQVL
jgi:hypothetical protein